MRFCPCRGTKLTTGDPELRGGTLHPGPQRGTVAHQRLPKDNPRFSSWQQMHHKWSSGILLHLKVAS